MLDGDRWLADIGFGGSTCKQPMSLSNHQVAIQLQHVRMLVCRLMCAHVEVPACLAPMHVN